jgi:hypothetical protein
MLLFILSSRFYNLIREDTDESEHEAPETQVKYKK